MVKTVVENSCGFSARSVDHILLWVFVKFSGKIDEAAMDVNFYQLKGVRQDILKIKKESGKFDSALNHGHILRSNFPVLRTLFTASNQLIQLDLF